VKEVENGNPQPYLDEVNRQIRQTMNRYSFVLPRTTVHGLRENSPDPGVHTAKHRAATAFGFHTSALER
jgi:hypothetical protein